MSSGTFPFSLTKHTGAALYQLSIRWTDAKDHTGTSQEKENNLNGPFRALEKRE